MPAPMSKTQPPRYRLHKPSGQGVVTFARKDHYLGTYNTRESLEAYHRIIAEWHANGEQLLPFRENVSILELTAAFLRHAQQYYRKSDGTPTSETDNFRQAFRPLEALHGTTPARIFGPKALRAVQQEMIRRDWCRRNINTQINRIRSFFKWAVSHELIPSTVYDALRTVAPLKRGRCGARESAPVRPVPIAHVDAIQPYVSRQVWALIQLQLYTGARAGELVIMRPIDLEVTSNGAWLYRPAAHKTEHHGHERVIAIGPKAQACLSPFLAGRRMDAYVFSASEAETERRAARHALRVTPISCGNRPGTSVKAQPQQSPGDYYGVDSYRRAIARACLHASVPPWHPHQLRHNAATEMRRRFGLETARAVLGHQSAQMTELYAEIDCNAAIAAARQFG